MNDPRRSRSWPRRTVAVLAGLVTVVALSVTTDAVMHAAGVFPSTGTLTAAWAWGVAIGYRFAFSMLGGWVAARLDPAKPTLAAGILATLGLVLGLLGVAVSIGHPEMGPSWYAWGVALTGPPATWIGGRLLAHNPSRLEAK